MIASLESQKASLHIRRETLLLKKHKLAVFIANTDGTSVPDAPILGDRGVTRSPASAVLLTTPIRSSGTSPQSKLEESKRPSLHFSSIPPPPIQPNSSTPANATSQVIQLRAKVLYDFTATPGSQELSVSKGALLEVLEKLDDGYIIADIVGGIAV